MVKIHSSITGYKGIIFPETTGSDARDAAKAVLHRSSGQPRNAQPWMANKYGNISALKKAVTPAYFRGGSSAESFVKLFLVVSKVNIGDGKYP